MFRWDDVGYDCSVQSRPGPAVTSSSRCTVRDLLPLRRHTAVHCSLFYSCSYPLPHYDRVPFWTNNVINCLSTIAYSERTAVTPSVGARTGGAPVTCAEVIRAGGRRLLLRRKYLFPVMAGRGRAGAARLPVILIQISHNCTAQYSTVVSPNLGHYFIPGLSCKSLLLNKLKGIL